MTTVRHIVADITAPVYGCMLAVVLLAALAVLWYRRRTRRTLKRLDRMLDAAIRGDFTEETFDESMLSAVEARLAQYLAASAVSTRKIQEEKDKIKTLIADISHQTKTPLANVLLYAQLLGEQELTAEGRACAAALEGQAEKLRALIEALVKTSRLESGVIALRPVPGPLAPTLRSAAAQLAPQAERKGVALTVEEGEADAVFDPKWTEEAVFNLLDNAVKYTPAGGQVRVCVQSYSRFARVDVTDTGPGIPEEEQAKVFQRFYRGADHPAEEGVGIGLYLVRQIAQGQGGYVKVASRPGRGAQFSLYLPRQ